RRDGALPAGHLPGPNEAAGTDVGLLRRQNGPATLGRPTGAVHVDRADRHLLAAPERLVRRLDRGPADRRRTHPAPAPDTRRRAVPQLRASARAGRPPRAPRHLALLELRRALERGRLPLALVRLR